MDEPTPPEAEQDETVTPEPRLWEPPALWRMKASDAGFLAIHIRFDHTLLIS
jgi:hypothetical protein